MKTGSFKDTGLTLGQMVLCIPAFSVVASVMGGANWSRRITRSILEVGKMTRCMEKVLSNGQRIIIHW